MEYLENLRRKPETGIYLGMYLRDSQYHSHTQYLINGSVVQVRQDMTSLQEGRIGKMVITYIYSLPSFFVSSHSSQFQKLCSTKWLELNSVCSKYKANFNCYFWGCVGTLSWLICLQIRFGSHELFHTLCVTIHPSKITAEIGLIFWTRSWIEITVKCMWNGYWHYGPDHL